MAEFLNYGAIGLGLALAILSYRLLAKEQARTEVRKNMLSAIYVFMLLTIVIFGGGVFLEAIKSNGSTVTPSAAQAAKPEAESKLAIELAFENVSETKYGNRLESRDFIKGMIPDISSAIRERCADEISQIENTPLNLQLGVSIPANNNGSPDGNVGPFGKAPDFGICIFDVMHSFRYPDPVKHEYHVRLGFKTK